MKSVLVAVVWGGVVAAAALWLVDRLIGWRANEEMGTIGRDLTEHGEEGYHMA